MNFCPYGALFVVLVRVDLALLGLAAVVGVASALHQLLPANCPNR